MPARIAPFSARPNRCGCAGNRSTFVYNGSPKYTMKIITRAGIPRTIVT